MAYQVGGVTLFEVDVAKALCLDSNIMARNTTQEPTWKVAALTRKILHVSISLSLSLSLWKKE